MRSLKPLCLALAALSLSNPALAQSRSDALQAALSQYPVDLFDQIGDRTVEIVFADPRVVQPVAVLQSFQVELAAKPDVMALARVLPPDMRDLLDIRRADNPMVAPGLIVLDVETALSITAPPLSMWSLGLADGAGARLKAGLTSLGFETEIRGDVPVFWQGADDFSMDLANRNRDNPFDGNMGRSARVAIAGDQLHFSPSWSAIDTLLAETESDLTRHPAISSLMAALDSEAAGQGGLAQALILNDPGQYTLMVADIVNGTALSGVFAMTTTDGADAVILAETIARNWAETDLGNGRGFADLFDADPVIVAHSGEPGVVTLRVDGIIDYSDAQFRNPISNRFMRLIFMGDIEMLTVP